VNNKKFEDVKENENETIVPNNSNSTNYDQIRNQINTNNPIDQYRQPNVDEEQEMLAAGGSGAAGPIENINIQQNTTIQPINDEKLDEIID